MNHELLTSLRCPNCGDSELDDPCRLHHAGPSLLRALRAFLFSFDEVQAQEGYEGALKRLCTAKRAARTEIARAGAWLAPNGEKGTS